LKPRQVVDLTIRKASGEERKVPVLARIDTPIEADYYRHGGILPYVLRQLLGGAS
jgi:aconitate hydratase